MMPQTSSFPKSANQSWTPALPNGCKKEGDIVAAGDPLVELETDKIDLEVAAPQAGVLSRIDRTATART